MSWTPKRFWKTATVAAEGEGFTVLLDTRKVKTPAKAPLVVPTEGLARLIAAEWDAQQGTVKPETMPATRMANSAIDKVVPQYDEVAALLAAYGETDHLCYRAEKPAALIDRQKAAWDPLLNWAAEVLKAPLHTGHGVIHIAQPPESLAALHGQVRALGNFRLAAFHDLVSLSGSLILAFAVAKGRLDPQTAWEISRIDEVWQIEQWGEDEEAAELTEAKRLAFHEAARFFALCQ